MENHSFHRFMYAFALAVVSPLLKLYMGYSCRKYKGSDVPSLIVSNHTTDVDPALVALGFSRQMYFLASEHAFRAGFASKVLKSLFAPIPFNKTKTDVAAIKEVVRRLKAGANVCIFSEGDRSFTGITAPSSISIAKLAKVGGADLITFRIEGGYLTWPRWSKKMRRGKMAGRLVNKYSIAELHDMTEKEVLEKINQDIYEDAYARQGASPISYRGKNLAENIETALFLCPTCCGIGTIKSKGDRFYCRCGFEGVYTVAGYLQGENLPFSTTVDWGRWQEKQLAQAVQDAGDGTICDDVGQTLFEVQSATNKVLVGEGAMKIDRKAFSCCGLEVPLDHVTKFAVVGQMTLLFATKEGAMYEVRSRFPISALKYREIFKVLMGR